MRIFFDSAFRSAQDDTLLALEKECTAMDIIKTTQSYVKHRFLTELSREDGYYRYTHTLRVAEIGRQIARAEGLDEEMLVLGCLLHDIGYVACKTKLDYADHGLRSAEIAAQFLREQGYDATKAESICYGIRVHTQEDGERVRPVTVLEDSVSDADNIDRFDAWRFSRGLCWDGLDKLSIPQMKQLAMTRCQRMGQLRLLRFATETGRKLWNEKLDLWAEFYSRLEKQMDATLEWDKDI